MQMTIEINGLQAATDRLQRIAVGFHDEMGPALAEIGELGSKYFGGVAFQSKGSAFGMPWEPLADTTVTEKDRAGYRGYPDMVRSGALMNGFKYEIKGSASVELFNDVPYFPYHQSAEEREKLPRRVLIGVNDTLKTIAHKAVTRQVKVIIEGSKI